MTISWSDWEFQEESGLEFEYQPVPPDTKDVTRMPRVGADGRAEIKPHNWKGIAGGLDQLNKYKGAGPKVLITYRPLNSAGNPADNTDTRPAAKVQVFATNFTSKMTPDSLLQQPWWDLGSFKPPARIELTLENRGLFGAAIEPYVRKLFDDKVLLPSRRTIKKGTGGNRKGPDVMWTELADLYAELGRELRDPLYAELALELSG